MRTKQRHTHVRNRGHVRLNKDNRMVKMFGFRQASDDVTVWDSRSVSQQHAENEEAAGRASRVFVDEALVGWRQNQAHVAGKATPTSLTNGTMEAVVNAVNSPLSPAERRQVEKFLAWQSVGDTRAPGLHRLRCTQLQAVA